MAIYIDGEKIKQQVVLSNQKIRGVNKSQGKNDFAGMIGNIYTLPSRVKKTKCKPRCYQRKQSSESKLNNY